MSPLLPWLGAALGSVPALAAPPPRPVLVVIAPHPDDAEASCGGLMINASTSGHDVIVLSMTAGEIGVGGKTQEEARALRTIEARRAAGVVGARLELFGAVDGSLVADAAAAEKLTSLLARLHPDVVAAPWPLDVHPDHQAAGMLAWRAFHDRRSTFELFFYETANGPHTTSFRFVPTDYVDVTRVFDQKREATYQHASQNPADWFEQYRVLARARGYEADVDYAEGYVRARSSSGLGGRPGRTLATLAARADGAAPDPDWARLERYRADDARLGAPRPGEQRVVFYGDSITEGWFASHSPAAGRPWIGRGISGQTTAQMLVRFQQDVVALAPRVVVILAGTNDIATNTGPYREDDTFANLEAMAELARAHGIRVVLASILPASDYPWNRGLEPAPKITALNARLRDYARGRGLVWLDYHAAMADEHGGLRPGLGDDGVHPNREGFAIMAPLAERAVAAALAVR